MDPSRILIGALMFAFFGLVIYLLAAGGVTLAYKFHMGAGTPGGFWYQERANWIPESWLDWAGYPGKFKKIVNKTSPNASIYEELEDVTLEQCMLKCDKKNSNPEEPECVGFIRDEGAKKCYMADGLEYIDESTSNTVYLYNSANYTNSVTTFTANTAHTLQTFTLTSPSHVETAGLSGCKANCYSNVSCNGFIFNPTSKDCSPISDMDATKLIASTTLNSYIRTSDTGSDDTTVYWKKTSSSKSSR